MERVLVVSGSEKGRDFFAGIFQNMREMRITEVKTAGEARRVLLDTDIDLVIINAPLPDEKGWDLAIAFSKMVTSGVVLLAPAVHSDEIAARVEEYGVFVLAKPLSKPVFFQALRVILAAGKRLALLKEENRRLQQKIQDVRIIDRAKCTLIQYLNMTEHQAHHYIEKQAMDLRISRREVSEEILKTYEN